VLPVLVLLVLLLLLLAMASTHSQHAASIMETASASRRQLREMQFGTLPYMRRKGAGPFLPPLCPHVCLALAACSRQQVAALTRLASLSLLSDGPTCCRRLGAEVVT
jgi:hypothetical protein